MDEHRFDQGIAVLFIRHQDGECIPVVKCHACNQTIVLTSQAYAVYARSTDADTTFRIAISHGDGCLHLLERTLSNDLGPPHCLDLDDYLDRLQAARTVSC
jgi:hypothetical protein